MKKLPAQHLKPSYFEPIESQLIKMFYEILFKPLVMIGQATNDQMTGSPKALLNAPENALQIAMRNGRIQYEAGVFSGDFNAATVKVMRSIGAKYDARQKVYKIEPALAPGWVKAEAASYQQTAKGAHAAMEKALDEIQQNLTRDIHDRTIHAQKTMAAIQKDFQSAAKALSVSPRLTEDSSNRLAADYNKNMKLYVTDFLHKEVKAMRDTVRENAQRGYRFDRLIDGIRGRYSVSQSKAKFLARQETSLFMSKFRRERFTEAGVDRYRWSTSNDARVRPESDLTPDERMHAGNHRILDGQTFSYSGKAPAKYMSSGSPCNPGEDFNCRCVDIPILDRVAVEA